MKTLKIGSIEIPARSSLDLEQTYEPLGGETILRTLSGAGIKQATWQKTRTVISGGGWIPGCRRGWWCVRMAPPGITSVPPSASCSMSAESLAR